MEPTQSDHLMRQLAALEDLAALAPVPPYSVTATADAGVRLHCTTADGVRRLAAVLDVPTVLTPRVSGGHGILECTATGTHRGVSWTAWAHELATETGQPEIITTAEAVWERTGYDPETCAALYRRTGITPRVEEPAAALLARCAEQRHQLDADDAAFAGLVPGAVLAPGHVYAGGAR